MADVVLSSFVKDALGAGQSKQRVESVLLEAGWAKAQVTDALGKYSSVDFPIPVPSPKIHVSARDAFLYLVMFSALYYSTYHFVSLIFQFISLALPENMSARGTIRMLGSIRWSTASLLISYPVFLFIAIKLSRIAAEYSTHRISPVRKWLTYLTLFSAVCVIAGNLTTLLHSMLSGELTLRFVLKVLVLGIVSGTIFAYYLWSLRVDDEALAT